MAKKPPTARPGESKSSKTAPTERKSTSKPTKKARSAAKPKASRSPTLSLPEMSAVLNVNAVFEFAAVRVSDWDSSIDLVPFASLRATEDEVLNLSCYSHGSTKRNRAWFSEVARRRAPVCRSSVEDDFVIVRMIAFR